MSARRMSARPTTRLPRPIALLVLVLTALLAPASPSVAMTQTTAVVRHVASSHVAPARPTSGRADHRSDHSAVTVVTAKAPSPVHSTAAADRRPGAPRLLLVQRPRPPTDAPARPAVDAPNGRSPPSPAGT